MKWIGQNIYDNISRFRDDVYLEDISTGTIVSGGNLGLDSNNKIVKATSSGGIAFDGSTANGVLTFKDSDEATVESNLTYDGTDLTVTSSSDGKPVLTLKTTHTTTGSSAELQFLKDAADTEDGEDLGLITFYGEDEGNNNTKFAQIKGKIAESDESNEGGKLVFGVATHDAEIQNGLQIFDGNAEDEVDVTIGSGTASLTTITGTLTMGSTATLDNSGLLQVANQTGITGVGTISSGVWQGTAIASAYLDSDTAHLSGVQTFSGRKTFSDTVTLDGDMTKAPGDGAALHIDGSDITDGTTSASGTATKYTHVNIENPRLIATNASVTTSDAATLYVKNAPLGATNQTITRAWSMWVDDGNARFDGSIYSGTTEAINSSGVVQVAAQTVIDHDQLANFAANEHFTQANITTVGTIGTGVWQGTAIASAYIADDAVTFAKASGVAPNVYGNIIKLIPSDFATNGDGGNTKFGVGYTDSAGTGYGMRVPNNATELYAFVSIPEGMKATHVDIFDKTDLAFEVFEVQINATTMTSKGSGNCNTTLDITDVNSTATNVLAIEVTTTSTGDRIYGGQVTIAAI